MDELNACDFTGWDIVHHFVAIASNHVEWWSGNYQKYHEEAKEYLPI